MRIDVHATSQVAARRPPHRRTPTAGFTLLELAAVLGLLAILAALAVLNHQAVRARLHLSAAARQVTLDLKLMRLRAITRHASHRLVFTAGSESYQRQHKRGDSYADDGPAVTLPRGIVVTDCSAAGDAISFRPRGNAGTFGTVTLQNARGDVRRIIVDIAGQVRVE